MQDIRDTRRKREALKLTLSWLFIRPIYETASRISLYTALHLRIYTPGGLFSFAIKPSEHAGHSQVSGI